MKKIKKILMLGILLFAMGTTFGSDNIILSTNKQTVDINDTFNIKLTITDLNGSVKLKEIKGLDNFDILGQSNSSSFVSINGQQKAETNLIITLQGKKSGEFTIGPAIVENNGKIIKSNTVKIKIEGAKIMLNNTQNTLLNSSNTSNTTNNNVQSQTNNNNLQTQAQEPENFEENIQYRKLNKPNYLLYFLMSLVLIGIWIVYYLLKDKQEQTNQDDIKMEYVAQPKEELTIPSINDELFVEKADEYIRNLLGKKYNIKNINSLTYNEIINLIPKNKEIIKQIAEIIGNYKYGGYIIDKTKLYELIKEMSEDASEDNLMI